METTELHGLSCKWNLYYHLQTDNSWTQDSYKVIMKEIDTVESINALNDAIPEYLLYNCMFFCMKNGIAPCGRMSRTVTVGVFRIAWQTPMFPWLGAN